MRETGDINNQKIVQAQATEIKDKIYSDIVSLHKNLLCDKLRVSASILIENRGYKEDREIIKLALLKLSREGKLERETDDHYIHCKS